MAAAFALGGRSAALYAHIRGRACESVCRGVAVVPGKNKNRLQAFSYRKHFVYASGAWRWVKVDGFEETVSPAVAFMDEDERDAIEFVDFWRMRRRVFEGSPEIKRAITDRSEARIERSLSRHFDFSACFSGLLAQKAQTQLPLIERNERRPGDAVR
ncbi:hypothetical protein [Bradyrhizobium sp. 2TAF24]|uniref:hypothetical protein n=1 Tax=Bradyrhizobium sp. 2TAF24 TaxID=3233011 RepID=UPI003F92E8E0